MSPDTAKALRERARRRYKPKKLKYLIIAEAPPSGQRFFYFEDVRQHDWLFLGIMGVLYPKEFAGYTPARSLGQKRELLRKFQAAGFWLLDAVNEPLIGAPPAGPPRVRTLLEESDLLSRLKRLRSSRALRPGVPIILVKATVFDAFSQPLRDARYSVIGKKIPFPSSGQQTNFARAFAGALRSLERRR